MAYVHCVSGEITEFKHNLDNTIEGKISTTRGDFFFKSRGHVVKTTNKIYQNNAWKPSRGAKVLFDGDINTNYLIIDHIELDHLSKINKTIINDYTDILLSMMKSLPVATKDIRYNPVDKRFRFTGVVAKKDSKGAITEEILHGSLSEDGWRFWTTTKKGGKISATCLDDESEIILARAVGLGSEKSKTAKEIQEEEKMKRKSLKVEVAAPFDDCPF